MLPLSALSEQHLQDASPSKFGTHLENVSYWRDLDRPGISAAPVQLPTIAATATAAGTAATAAGTAATAAGTAATAVVVTAAAAATTAAAALAIAAASACDTAPVIVSVASRGVAADRGAVVIAAGAAIHQWFVGNLA